jgi:hypothetical protein
MFADPHREVATLRLLALGTWAFLVVLPNWWDVHLATLLRRSPMLIIRTKTGLFYSPLFDQFLHFFNFKIIATMFKYFHRFIFPIARYFDVINTWKLKRQTV